MESEIQADFGHITAAGEVTYDDSPKRFKIRIVAEPASNRIGYVLVTKDTRATKTHIGRCLDDFGLAGKRIPYSFILMLNRL